MRPMEIHSAGPTCPAPQSLPRIRRQPTKRRLSASQDLNPTYKSRNMEVTNGWHFFRALVLMACVCQGARSVTTPLAEESSVINTDRPSFSNSAVIVPIRSLQIECGWAEQSSQDISGARTQLTTQTPPLRIGLWEHGKYELGQTVIAGKK